MWIELTDGEVLELSDDEARSLYETLLERAGEAGARSAAVKIRPVLAWSSGAGSKVALSRLETAVVRALRGDATSSR